MRSVLAIMGGSGVYFAAQVRERTARAATLHKPMDEEKWGAAGRARALNSSTATSSASSGQERGLVADDGAGIMPKKK